MELILKKPLGGLRALMSLDPHINDLAGLLMDIKPAIYTGTDDANRPYILDLCRKFGLKKTILQKTRAHANILLAKTSRALAAAEKAYRKSVCSFEWGIALGYPECCVRSYLQWKKGIAAVDLVEFIFRHTRPRDRFPFLMNNVFNYFSRIMNNPGDTRLSERIAERNLSLGLSHLSVISWHPCSYHCRESIEKGRRIYGFMQEYVPEFADMIKKALSKPVVFLGKFEFAVLSAVSPGKTPGTRTVPTGRILAPVSLLKAGRLRSMSHGGRLTFTQNGELAGAGKNRRCILLPFSPRSTHASIREKDLRDAPAQEP